MLLLMMMMTQVTVADTDNFGIINTFSANKRIEKNESKSTNGKSKNEVEFVLSVNPDIAQDVGVLAEVMCIVTAWL